MLINIASFIYFKQQSGLGNRFQAILNIVDFVACLYFITVAILGFSINEQSENQRPIAKNIDIIGTEFYTLLILLSGLITVFLSVIRTILSTQPFYEIRNRVVYASFLGISILFLGITIADAVMIEVPTTIQLRCTIYPALKFQLPAVLLEAIPSALLMLILAVSSLLTWRALSKPNNHLSNHSHAANTALIISTVYVVLIGTIVTARAFIRLNPANYTDKNAYKNHLAQLGKVSILKLANSVLNPLIFIARSKNLRLWVVGLFRRGAQKVTKGVAITSTTTSA
eukprot:sb/3467798/